MGIAGFFVWLQRHYAEAIDGIDGETGEVILNRRSSGHDDRRGGGRDGGHHHHHHHGHQERLPPYDNLYLDMNGLIHPCCHDTHPLPEPKSEEEMFQRIFTQLDQLIKTVQPRKCLVLAVDGVAPRSKMNQQRARRFRAATERQESNEISEQMAEVVVQNHQLPRPAMRAKWDHNVITPSTPFMERVGQVLEWYVVSRLNSGDPLWKNLTVVLSDAHVPGEGEHKIMHYIRGLRAEPGYDPKTSHVVYGMDADLICLGLATHEVNFGVLRNVLNRETFQAEPNQYCIFNVRTFRRLLRRDFSNIRDADFERIVDDFVFLCFFIGNDFLPHMPLVDIKCRGIETMLDHYVRRFDDFGYLTKEGNISFVRLRQFLAGFVADKMDSLLELKEHKSMARERAQRNVEGRIEQMRQSMRHALSQLKPDRSNSVEVSQEVFRCYSETAKEQTRFVGGKFPLSFEYGAPGYRDAFYSSKFGWTAPDPEKEAEGDMEQQKLRDAFEQQIEMCCREYLRGMHWVMRYYTVSCPSWEWFYPYHYAPLIDDVARYCNKIDVEMRLGEPLHPVEQLLAVLPLESYHALPTELHPSVLDPSSVFAKFYPKEMTVDFTEATFAYQGVIQLPFINCQKLRRACNSVCQLEPDEGSALIFCHDSAPLARKLSRLLQNRAAGTVLVPLPSEVTALVPIAGRAGLFPYAWPLHAGIACPDKGLAELPEGEPVKRNMCRTFAYEMNLHAAYIPRLLTDDVDARRSVSTHGRRDDRREEHRDDRRREDNRGDNRRDTRSDRGDVPARDDRRRNDDRSREGRRRDDRAPPPREAGRKRARTPEPAAAVADPARPPPSAAVTAIVAAKSPKHTQQPAPQTEHAPASAALIE